jgi:hypothetical protein
MCVLIFSTTFVWEISHSKKKWARYNKKCILIFLSDFNETWIFSTDFRKILKYQISWKSSIGNRVVPCGRKDRRTDMTKLIVVFRNFANAPKTGACTHVSRGYELSILVFTDPEHYDYHSAITFIDLFLSFVQYSPYVSRSQTSSIIFFP